jgi:hypothetical protein
VARPVEFHEDAAAEAVAAVAWYSERNADAGDAFAAALAHAVGLVEAAPERWPVASGDVRRVHLARFPFTIFYRSRNEVTQVLAIAHQRRKPGYWNGRTL